MKAKFVCRVCKKPCTLTIDVDKGNDIYDVGMPCQCPFGTGSKWERVVE
jgi:hypothetical protein